MERVLKDAAEAKKPLAEVAEKWSRPGLRIRIHAQEEPLDQYGVEKIPGLGGANCPLRFALNEFGKDKEGAYAKEVVEATARVGVLEERGWVVFQVRKVVPEEIPPLDAVREKVVAQMLDEKARDRARADLEALRKAAEDARKTLEEIAREKGVECATAGPFNAYSWRPPSPKPTAGETAPPAADRWKDPDRRASSVMSRFTALRDIPAGSFGPVLEDVEGSGALYLVQMKSRTDPAFDEMSQAQIGQARRSLVRERMGALGQELSYERLKERFSLTIGGEAAPAAEDLHRGGGRAPKKR
jgi:hypothetical protein